MTALYSLRLFLLVFHSNRQNHHQIVKLKPIMELPLLILAAGAIFSGYIGYAVFNIDNLAGFWQDDIFAFNYQALNQQIDHLPLKITKLPLLAAISGLSLALFIYYRNYQRKTAIIKQKFTIIDKLLSNRWYFDQIYYLVLVKPILKLGKFFAKRVDRQMIDLVGPKILTKLTIGSAKLPSKSQTGYVYHYALVVILGLLAVISWFFVSAFI